MHSLDSTLAPGQSSPPNVGGGLVQVLDRFCTPPPHVTGQSSQGNQSAQLPAPVKVMSNDLYYSLSVYIHYIVRCSFILCNPLPSGALDNGFRGYPDFSCLSISFIHCLLIISCIESFIHSFNHCFIYLLIYSFI